MRAVDQDDVSRVDLSSGCRILCVRMDLSFYSGLDLDPIYKHALSLDLGSRSSCYPFRCSTCEKNNHTKKDQTLECTFPPLSLSSLQRCDRTTTPYHPLPSLGVARHLTPSQACRGWSSNLDRRRDQYLIFCPYSRLVTPVIRDTHV